MRESVTCLKPNTYHLLRGPIAFGRVLINTNKCPYRRGGI